MNIFEQTPPNRRRYGLAAFIGLRCTDNSGHYHL
ncbi:hypothetical protein ACFMEF_005521, partial [Escherichia coli]